MINGVDPVSYGWAYDVVLFMLFLVAAADAISMVKCFKSGEGELREYAHLCVKYLKIIMLLTAGVFFVYVCAAYTSYDGITRAIHGILGVMLLVDAAAGLILKIKYRRRTGDTDEKDG